MEQMSELEKMIVGLLEGCRGEENAVRRRNLVEILSKFEDRKVREAINHLVTAHGVAIASSPKGYYTPITPEEIRKACDYYHSYAISCLVRESRLSGRPLAEIMGQLNLDFEDKG
jgi:hypothetical protein